MRQVVYIKKVIHHLEQMLEESDRAGMRYLNIQQVTDALRWTMGQDTVDPILAEALRRAGAFNTKDFKQPSFKRGETR